MKRLLLPLLAAIALPTAVNAFPWDKDIIIKTDLDEEYIVKDYSIADIAIWPWVDRCERHEINLEDYPNIKRWYDKISIRPAVIKGYNAV